MRVNRIKLIFALTLITLSLLIVLIGVAARNLFEHEFVTIIGTVLFVIIVNGLGIVDADKNPVRKLLLTWSKKAGDSWWRKWLVYLVLGIALWEITGLGYCYYNRYSYFTHLKLAENSSKSLEGPKHIGKAYTLFPSRPESFVIYYRIRQYYKNLDNAKTKLRQFASSFLEDASNQMNCEKFPFLFCCSCARQEHYQLLRSLAKAETGKLNASTVHESSQDNIHENLLWLVMMSEKPTLEQEELEKLHKQMKKVAEDDKFHNSPIYPLVLDHLLQLEKQQFGCTGNSLNNLKKYTKNFFAYYLSYESSDPISLPQKTIIHYLILRIEDDQNEIDDFSELNKYVTNFIASCPDYYAELQDLVSKDSKIVEKMTNLGNTFGEIEQFESMDKYLSFRKKIDWMKLRLIME